MVARDLARALRRVAAAAALVLSGPASAQPEPLPPALELPPPPARVAFVDVAVVETGGARPGVRRGQTVVVQDGEITSVAPNTQAVVPAGVRRVPATGLFLMPGLVDMHAHLAVPPGDEGAPVFLERDRQTLALYLAAGVTTIRSLWGSPSALDARRRVAQGVWPGPRVVTAGPIVDARAVSQRGTPFDVRELAARPTTMRVATGRDGVEAVLAHAAAGYDLVKVYDGVPAPAYHALAELAWRRWLPVVGHVPDAVGLSGVLTRPGPSHASIEHVEAFVDAALPPEAELPDDFLAAELARYALADTTRFAVWAEAAAARGVAVVPTLGLLARTRGARADGAALLAAIDAARTSDGQRARWRAVAARHAARLARFDSLGLDGEALGRAPLQAGFALVRALHRAGAPLLLGTDAPASLADPGQAVAAELALLVRAGLSPLDALGAATAEPRAWFDRLQSRAVPGPFAPGFARGPLVRPGAPAELVLLRADPTLDVGAVRAVEMVVRDGHLWDRAALDVLLDGVDAAYGHEKAGARRVPSSR